MSPFHGAHLLEMVERKCWEGSVSPLRTRKGFNCWVHVYLFCHCHHHSTWIFHRHCMGASPEGADSCAITCVWCAACSFMLPSGHKTRWCVPGLLLVFPSPNLYVINSLYIIEDTLCFRQCTLYLRSSKSLYCVKIKLCYAKEHIRHNVEHLTFLLFLNSKFGVFHLY